mmetsp:Transcript_46670/g.108768  ORF Transcript_46670/g.108768 Transcript_46670/m.108768 type:complete len:218 (+) Transcript_46670:63-716(+)
MRHRFSKDVSDLMDAASHAATPSAPSEPQEAKAGASLLQTIGGFYSAVAKHAEAYKSKGVEAQDRLMHKARAFTLGSPEAYVWCGLLIGVVVLLCCFLMSLKRPRSPRSPRQQKRNPAPLGRAASAPAAPPLEGRSTRPSLRGQAFPSSASSSSVAQEVLVKKSQMKGSESSDSENVSTEDSDSDEDESVPHGAKSKEVDHLVRRFEELQKMKFAKM